MKHVIAVNNGEDYILLTGLGNTWSYSDKETATAFDSKKEATAFMDRMPKHLILSVEPAATPSPLPETETGVSIDTPTEAGDWQDFEKEVNELEEALFDEPTGAPPTPGNERQDSGEDFTEGEWKITTNEELHHTEFKIESNGWNIATLNPYAPENSNAAANARLICNSKAMYRALKELLKDECVRMGASQRANIEAILNNINAIK